MVTCCCIIPCHNEAPRCAAVIRAARGARGIERVLVVDDGSRDGTAAVARRAGADVLLLRPNRGKAEAMDLGVRAVSQELILFLDGDLHGIEPRHVEQLLEPVLNERAGMSIGLVTSGDAGVSQAWLPVLAGQRAMHRIFWLRTVARWPDLLRQRFGIEMGLTQAANEWLGMKRVAFVKLQGVGHEKKEAKFGLLEGATRRALMYADIARTTKYVTQRGR